MLLSQANKILLVSFYAGLAIKEHYLASELDRVPDAKDIVTQRAVKARLVQLEQERKDLVNEGRDLDRKISDLKARMGRA